MAIKEVTKLWVYQAQYRIPIIKEPSGFWVLIEGVDTSIIFHCGRISMGCSRRTSL